ncbi:MULTISPECIES: FUSC family protein [unclassified Lentimonas]|uniref:FUSC family protein n=1 Tax=unclassified Lentimonas TaxID=2630993 RepID=UPI001389877A|nr:MULTISPECIES: FUSC family protein [unclassified Lentimonas]
MTDFPSRRAKESIKTALAMVIAYGLALGFGWERPLWAGFVVAFCSLATIGQSFTKAAYRMSGTLVAVVLSLLLISMFPQERWLFMGTLSLFVGFCTYMMSGPNKPYFWNITGVVAVIICMDTGPDPSNAFHIAVLRTEETALGILVYSVIALLLWPVSSRSAFIASVGDQINKQRDLSLAAFHTVGTGNHENYAPAKTQTAQAQARFKQLLGAALRDTTEVKEKSAAWQSYASLVGQLTEAVERLSHGFAELQTPEIAKQLPDIEHLIQETEQRFDAMEQMVKGHAPDAPLQPAIEYSPDPKQLKALPHFQRAAVVIAYQRINSIAQISQALLEQMAGITDCGPMPTSTPTSKVPAAFDIDRGISAVKAMTTFWIACIGLIYIEALPGGSGLVTMATSIGMVCASTPQLPVRKLVAPFMLSIAAASLIYLCIMPRLSGFAELGILLFIATFAFCYLFAAPQQMLNRACSLAMLLAIASVSNHQSYSFAVVSNTAMMFAILLFILLITANIPYSPRPERMILRLLRRFFKSYHTLVEIPPPSGNCIANAFRRLHQNFHRYEVSTLPAKMGTWAQFLNPAPLEGTDKAQVQMTINSVQGLSDRMNELIEIREAGQSYHLEAQLKDDFTQWRDYNQSITQNLLRDPASANYQQVLDQLSAIQKHLEARMSTIANQSTGTNTELHEIEAFYRRLSTYRGLSEALLNYAKQTDAINWTPWKEERFY